jgi:hypothetical protein
VDERRPEPRALIVADVAALCAFVVAGLFSHREASAPLVLARNLIPLLAVWGSVAALFGTYRKGSVSRMLLTWAVAAPVALLIRSALVGSPRGAALALFLVVGGGFTLLFLLAGRAVVALVMRRRPSRVPLP